MQAESERAYQDLKEFVLRVEQEPAPEDTALVWEDEAGKLKAEFHQHLDEVDSNIEHYQPHQRESIQDFRERFRIALSSRQRQHADIQRRYKLRQELLGMEVNADDMSQIGADQLAATYQKFVNNILQDPAKYSARDWQMIEGWWLALSNRKTQLESKLEAEDKELIAEIQEDYLELRRALAAKKP